MISAGFCLLCRVTWILKQRERPVLCHEIGKEGRTRSWGVVVQEHRGSSPAPGILLGMLAQWKEGTRWVLEVAVMLDPFTSSLKGVCKCKGGT